MKFTREIQGGTTYLVYQIQPEEQIDTLSLGMIVNNKIEGIAPTIYNQMDNQKFLKYNISSKVSLEQFFTGTVNRQRLLSVIDSVLEGITAAEDYMLESGMLLLFPSHIFVDVSTGKAVLICVPTLDMREQNVDIGTFFKAIMFNTRFDQSENGDYIAKIISYLNSTAEISVADFKQLVKGLLQETEDSVMPVASQTQFLNKISVAPAYPAEQMVKTEQVPMQPQTQAGQRQETQPAVDVHLLDAQEPASQSPKDGQAPAMEMGFAIPGDNAGSMELAGKKGKKKKEKKQKETVVKEKLPKQKKGFSLFGKKKKTDIEQQETESSNAVIGIPQNVTASPGNIPIMPSGGASAPSSANIPVVPPGNAPIAPPQISIGGMGETTVLGNASSGETVVLSGLNPDGQPNPRLTRVRNKEQISINKPVFRIGKERSYVDYFIGDNPAISRSHANIIIQQNGYYIEDMNSTNHTYVNDKMIVGGSAVKLEQDARIRLGNEEFIFQY